MKIVDVLGERKGLSEDGRIGPDEVDKGLGGEVGFDFQGSEEAKSGWGRVKPRSRGKSYDDEIK